MSEQIPNISPIDANVESLLKGNNAAHAQLEAQQREAVQAREAELRDGWVAPYSETTENNWEKVRPVNSGGTHRELSEDGNAIMSFKDYLSHRPENDSILQAAREKHFDQTGGDNISDKGTYELIADYAHATVNNDRTLKEDVLGEIHRRASEMDGARQKDYLIAYDKRLNSVLNKIKDAGKNEDIVKSVLSTYDTKAEEARVARHSKAEETSSKSDDTETLNKTEVKTESRESNVSGDKFEAPVTDSKDASDTASKSSQSTSGGGSQSKNKQHQNTDDDATKESTTKNNGEIIEPEIIEKHDGHGDHETSDSRGNIIDAEAVDDDERSASDSSTQREDNLLNADQASLNSDDNAEQPVEDSTTEVADDETEQGDVHPEDSEQTHEPEQLTRRQKIARKARKFGKATVGGIVTAGISQANGASIAYAYQNPERFASTIKSEIAASPNHKDSEKDAVESKREQLVNRLKQPVGKIVVWAETRWSRRADVKHPQTAAAQEQQSHYVDSDEDDLIPWRS